MVPLVHSKYLRSMPDGEIWHRKLSSTSAMMWVSPEQNAAFFSVLAQFSMQQVERRLAAPGSLVTDAGLTFEMTPQAMCKPCVSHGTSLALTPSARKQHSGTRSSRISLCMFLTVCNIQAPKCLLRSGFPAWGAPGLTARVGGFRMVAATPSTGTGSASVNPLQQHNDAAIPTGCECFALS